MPYPDRSGAVATTQAAENIVTVMEAQVKASTKVTIASLVIACSALVIAAGSLYFSYQNANDGTLWKQEQLMVLKKISLQLEAEKVVK